MRRRYILILILVLVVVGAAGGYIAVHHHNDKKVSPAPARSKTPEKQVVNVKAQKADIASFGNKSIILINQSIFGPVNAIVPVNSVVEWTNMEATTHQVVTDDGKTITAATSPVLAQGQNFDFTFTTAGTYAYHDNLHPKMKGTVKVQ